jgi:1,4-alpha-glucan branching enzyme
MNRKIGKTKKTSSTRKSAAKKVLAILKNDAWLEPFSDAINGRHQDVIRKEAELTAQCKDLVDFANAHQYFGMHRTADGGWVFREWAPNATAITLIGDFSDWKEQDKYALSRLDNGVWEVTLCADDIHHGDLYKMLVRWNDGVGERIPAYATRVVQDPQTAIFSAQVWAPEQPYKWKTKHFRPETKPLLIYECHIGMAQNREGVGTYAEFRDNVLPRIVADGYNAIQIMAIQEHPYYGSFGYHVSSFYAASSRFGTPDDLKSLILTPLRTKTRASVASTAATTSTSTATVAANTPRGTRSASTTAKTKCSTSFSPTANTGSKNTASTASASTA